MEKIWLKSYPDGIPAEINTNAYSSLVDLLLESTNRFSTRPAFSNYGTCITYHQFEQYTRDFAAFLQNNLHLQKGDRMAVMMPNTMHYPIAIFGAFRAGVIAVNVNPLYTARELIHQLNDAGVKVLLVLENFINTVLQALPEISVEKIIVARMGDLFPWPKSFLINSYVKYVKKVIPQYKIENSLLFKDVLQAGNALPHTPVPLNHDDIAFLQYTGGTTGVAKGAILTHGNMVANVMQADAWISHQVTLGEEIIVTALPLYHIFSLTANCLTFIKMGALNILISDPRDMKTFIRHIKKIKFTAFTGVNTLFAALLRQPNFAKVDFSHLKFTLGGGMAVQRIVAEKWHEVTGRPLLEAYGLTETSPAVTMNPLTLTCFNGTIGLPIPSTDVSMRSNDTHEVAIGEAGELCIKGPQVMRGYWHNDAETAKVFTPDGYLKSGDIATINEQGFVTIVDRKKDMIIISGFNVYPNEVEKVLMSNPKIAEAGVIGVPSEKTGEAVKAFIVSDDPNLTAEEVIQFCRGQLTAYKVPHLIEFRDHLPKSNVGKILRRDLRTHE